MRLNLPSLTTVSNLRTDSEALEHQQILFHANTAPADRKTILASSPYGILFFNPLGKLQKCIVPRSVTLPSRRPVGLMASLQDDLQVPSPVVLDHTQFATSVITVCDNGLAVDCGVPMLKETQYNPRNAKGAESENLPEDFDFGFDTPAFIALPLFCAYVPGSQIPDDLDLQVDLEESVLTSLLPHERLWVEGMHFLFQKNEGKSLLATASVIGPSSIPLADFTWQDLACPLDPTSLSPHAFSLYTGAIVGSEAYSRYTKTFKTAVAILGASHLVRDPDFTTIASVPAPVPAVTPDRASDPAEIIAQTIAAIKAGASDPAPSIAKERARLSWRLLFGQYVEQVDGTTVFVPAELSDEFEHVLKLKPGEALRHFHRAFAQMLKGLSRTRSAYDALLEWNYQRIQSAGIAAIQVFLCTERSISSWPEDLRTKLSLLQFLPSDHHDKGLAAHMADDATVLLQETMGEHSTKVAAKKTHLYGKGRCATITDVKKVIANFVAFGRFAVKHFVLDRPPHIIKLYDRFMEALSTNEATVWENTTDMTDVPVGILQDLNTIFESCVNLATDFNFQDQAKVGNLADTNLFNEANHQLSLLLETVRASIRSSRRADFPRNPLLAKLIHSEVDCQSPSAKRSPAPAQVDREASPAAKKAKFDPKDKSQMGLFVYTGRGRPKTPDFKWLYKGVLSSFCLGFHFVNFKCTRPNCPMIHVAKRDLADRTPSERTQLCTFVKETPNVAWAPGMEPRNG